MGRKERGGKENGEERIERRESRESRGNGGKAMEMEGNGVV